LVQAMLLNHALEIPVLSNAEQRAAARREWESVHDELQIRCVNPAVALPVGAGATRAVARAEARVACDKLDAAQPAVAAGMRAAAQELPEICGPVVRPTLRVHAELASSFEAEVLTFASSHLHLPCGPLSLAAGTTRQRREAKGKADFRDEQRALVTSSSSRYIVEAVEQAILSLSC
jgi:phage baseplate assembly protein W